MTMNDVLWRAKQIQYASRVAHHVDAVATKVNLRHAMRLLKSAGAPAVAALRDDAMPAARRLDIVHIIYRPTADQISSSDAEFSRSSIAERRAAGHRDMTAALAARPWQQRELPAHLGALVHRVERGEVTTRPEPNLRSMSDSAATKS
jgi:NTE family protein